MKNPLLLLLLLCIACGITNAQKSPDRIKETTRNPGGKKPIIKYGTASFYANKFNGRRTANGEIYNSKKYTAACNTLPLNTWIQVTNLRNHRSVIVKVNDRMHPKNKRLVDLSKIAAQKLGFSGSGLTRVKIEVLKNFHPRCIAFIYYHKYRCNNRMNENYF